MKGIRKMDEMELQITLRASRAAWFFLVLALVVWSVWEAFHGGDTTLPAFLLGVQAMIFCLVQWIGRAVVRAWNWLTSPGASGSLRTDRRIPVKVLR